VGRNFYLASIAVALLAAACSGGGDAATSVPAPSSGSPTSQASASPDVHVDGPVFVDAAGHTVVLRGVAVHTLDPVTYQRAPGLGVNFVRLAITWSDYEPTGPVDGVHHWDQARLADLDTEIAYFREHGIQVLIDLHQYGWSPYFATLQRGGRANGIPRWVYQGRRFALTVAGRAQAQAAMYTDRRATELYSDFAAMLAQRYRQSPNVVGYEILNEPPLGNLPRRAWAVQRIVRWQARVGAAVRAVDPQRAIVFMLPPRTDVRALRLTPLERLQGGDYRGTLANQASYLAPSVSVARTWGVPLIVGEWGAFPGEPGVGRYQQQMVTLFQQDGVSWSRWSLDRNERLGLLTREGQPTPAAAQLGRLLRGLPQQPS
jgi:hypothetical protein